MFNNNKINTNTNKRIGLPFNIDDKSNEEYVFMRWEGFVKFADTNYIDLDKPYFVLDNQKFEYIQIGTETSITVKIVYMGLSDEV